MMHLRSVLASLFVACAANHVSAATVVFQDVDGASGFTFGGVAVTDASFDDSQITTGGNTTANNSNYGGSGSVQLRTASNGVTDSGLIGIKDLFTFLPATDGSGNSLQITSATLSLAGSGNYSAGFNLTVRRATSNWLGLATGQSQNFVSGSQKNGTTRTLVSGVQYTVSGGTSWAGGGFGGSDLSSTNAVTVTFAPATYGAYQGVDVTNLVKDIYTAGVNYGFGLTSTSQTNYLVRSSDDTLLPDTHETFRPALSITYDYVPVPEPVSAGLLGLAVPMLMARRRGNA